MKHCAGIALAAITLIAIIGATASKAPATAFDFDRVPGMVAGMVFVEGGCFVMGDRFGDGYPDERPTHEVCLDDFYISKYEVTFGAFRSFVDATGYVTDAEKGGGCKALAGSKWTVQPGTNWRRPGFPQTITSPVVCVSHNDAKAYIKWKSRKDRKQYRLPTEAEWEYASRSRGRNFKYPWGNTDEPNGNLYDKSAHRNLGPIAALGNYHDGYIHTSPVGSFAPNLLELHDMAGNVWEWTQDFYSKHFYSRSPRTNPTGPAAGTAMSIRGGAWYSKYSCLRTSRRSSLPPGHSYTIVGFRLIMLPR